MIGRADRTAKEDADDHFHRNWRRRCGGRDCAKPERIYRVRHDPSTSAPGKSPHQPHWLVARRGARGQRWQTASLIVGVAAAAATRNDVLIAGVAGLVAGAMSMSA